MNVGDLKKLIQELPDDTEVVFDTTSPLLPNATYGIRWTSAIRGAKVRLAPDVRVYR